MIIWHLCITMSIRPNGYHIPDCVIRAITLALDIDYYEVVNLLHLNAQEFQCDCLNVKCYEKLLDIDFDLPHYMSFGKCVEEIAQEYPNNILIIRIEGHLTASVDGIVYDIWNCLDQEVTDYWVVD